MANVRNGSLKPIYQRLNSAPTYHPQETESFADWSVEAGDIVTVSREGTSYSSPVHSTSVTWKKGQKISMSSTGNQTRGSVSKMSQTEYSTGSSASGIRNTKKTYQHIVSSYNGMTSGLELASSSAALYVNNKYTQMEAGLRLTESSARLYVEDKYSQMESGLEMTSSSAALYVNNKYSQMQSGLKLTESSARLYVDDSYNQMTSGLELTSSSAALYVNNKYSQMSSGLKLTESSARLYVDNKYSQMQSGLEVTSSSAALYAYSRTTKAQIIARINSSGESEALINANRISITGNSTLSGSVTINNGKLTVKSGMNIQGDTFVTTVGAKIQSPNFEVAQGHIAFIYGGTTYNISAQSVGNMVANAAVSGNTLTLTKVDGTTVTFSKATTLSGAWDSGTLTVSASPQGNQIRFTLFDLTSQDVVWNGNTGIITVWANVNDGETKYDTGKRLRVTNPGSVISSLNIYDDSSNIVTSKSISSAIHLWAGYYDNTAGEWVWGTNEVVLTPDYSGWEYGVTQFKGVDTSGNVKEKVKMRYFNEQRGQWMDCDGDNLHKWYWKD